MTTKRAQQLAGSIAFALLVAACESPSDTALDAPATITSISSPANVIIHNQSPSDFGAGGIGTPATLPGDLDGDGYGDIVFVEGYCIRIAYGAKTWPHTLSTNTMAALVGSAGVSEDCMGQSFTSLPTYYESLGVASVGDVDRDGHADLLINTRRALVDSSPYQTETISYLVHGGPGRIVGRRLMTEVSEASFVGSGDARGLGDVNGDGFADFGGMVGSEIVVYLGNVHRFSGGVQPEQADVRLSFPAEYSPSFFKLQAAGDFNRDGFADFTVTGLDVGSVPSSGCEGLRGKLWLVMGGKDLAGALVLDSMPSFEGAILPDHQRDRALGDMDGDGFDDLVYLICQGNDPAQTILYGRAEVTTLSGPADAVVMGARALTSADVDGDGLLDSVFGDPSANQGNGVVYILRGTGARLTGTINPAQGSWAIPSTHRGDGSSIGTGENVGLWLAGGLDVDGDGLADVLVGASVTRDGEGQPSTDSDSNTGHMILLRGAAIKATWAP